MARKSSIGSKRCRRSTSVTPKRNFGTMFKNKLQSALKRKATPNRKCQRGKSPGSKATSTPKNHRGNPRIPPPSPRVLVSEYRSRGLLEPPVTIDNTLESITDDSVLESVDKTSRKRKNVFDRLEFGRAKKRQKGAQNHPGSSNDIDCTNASVKTLDETEDGEIKDDDSIQIINGPETPDVQIVVEKPIKNNPQSIFSRWNFAGKSGGIPNNATENFDSPSGTGKFAVAKRRKKSFIEKLKKGGKKRVREFESTVPTFDPSLKPNMNFAPEITIEKEIFHFNANKPNFPKMGVKQRQISSGKLKVASPNRSEKGGSTEQAFSNVYNPGVSIRKTGLRPIIIDGQNVAHQHHKAQKAGTGTKSTVDFSSRGIDICVDYFKRRNHKEIFVFVPHYRLKSGRSLDTQILHKLEQQNHLVTTPDKTYDDRYIVQFAAIKDGVIVSNDFFRDLTMESPVMAKTISMRRLPFSFVGDILMFPKDPLGIGGPTLDKFLSFD